MSRIGERLSRRWMRVGAEFLPFADAASPELPMPRLLRLSLFQVTVGMATVLLIGTLNRVLIVELGVSAWLVSAMVGLPLVFAPFRTLVGFASDQHRSALGWRRVPYIWMGTLLQFGGFAFMPFALLVLSGDTHGPVWIGRVASAFAFLLVGAGLQTVQTAGLALATDLAPPQTRPKVIALMYAMLLTGMVACGVIFGTLLANFSEIRLIQVVQGAAMTTMALNLAALWKQEPRRPSTRLQPASAASVRRRFREAWRRFAEHDHARRFLLAVGLGTAAFNMQDIVLEPYGGQILHLSVAATTTLTAGLATGALLAFAISARALGRGSDPCRLAAYGAVIGLFAFAAIIFAAPLGSAAVFRLGTLSIGFGGGFFSVGTLAGAMQRERGGDSGLALGAWGAVQATCAGVAIAVGGALRDLLTHLAVRGELGPALHGDAVGYGFVYLLEIALLFATLVVIGPLVRFGRQSPAAAAKAALLFQ
ncbi:MAG: MFS transporter [Gammaproteobacteria bacterium]|nr:MFS transporter [Gammaproteobacteria bacterium]